MKLHTTTLAIVSCFTVAMSAHAGDDYSAKGGKEVIAPPAPSCLWTWFAGGSAGYVSGDWDEDIYTLHVGVERSCGGDACTQALFLEVGFTNNEGTVYNPNLTSFNDYGLDSDIVPITLNYKYECALSGNLSWYAGIGAGIALIDLDVQAPMGASSWDETVFYGHIFAGIVYNVSESFEIFGGARYIYMEDNNLTANSFINDAVTLDSDVQLEIGGRVNF